MTEKQLKKIDQFFEFIEKTEPCPNHSLFAIQVINVGEEIDIQAHLRGDGNLLASGLYDMGSNDADLKQILYAVVAALKADEEEENQTQTND